MIKVNSLIKEHNKLIPVEVELTLWPGIPGIQFLGLPDQHLKESALRIKSAIRATGFQFPVAQQILVNLRPSHLKKTSRGLELAVAAAFLWETGQVSRPVMSSDFFVYGELSLSGQVSEPEDLVQLEADFSRVILTGSNLSQSHRPFRRQVIGELSRIESPDEVMAIQEVIKIKRPSKFSQYYFSQQQAELIKILAVGGHSALLAGAAGSGKSTLAQSLIEFLPEPTLTDLCEIRKVHKGFGEDLKWRPIVKPHHTTPLAAMVGGGNIPFAGEVSRAHGGILLLDELLEFSPKVQEALREPFEEGKMRVFRNGTLKEYPAKSQIIATTNLCPCGKWTPNMQTEVLCRFSRKRCRGYAERLSGPLLDRFELLVFFEHSGDLTISGESLLQEIADAEKFKREQSISDDIQQILLKFNPVARTVFHNTEFSSQRRKKAVIRIAQTLAVLQRSKQIKPEHLSRAKDLSLRSFSALMDLS